jgi:hypothetical protein
METAGSGETTWGKRPEFSDVRALRRYNALLRGVSTVGEWIATILVWSMVMLALWFLFTGDFEDVIFTDGTSLTCVLDGRTGEIADVKK